MAGRARASNRYSLAQRLGAGEHLALEIRVRLILAGVGQIDQHAVAKGHVRHHHLGGGRRHQQLAVDEHGGHERFRIDLRQTEALDELLLIEPLHVGHEGHELIARHRAEAIDRLDEPGSGEADVAAERDHIRRLTKPKLLRDVVHDVGDVPRQQADALLVRTVP